MARQETEDQNPEELLQLNSDTWDILEDCDLRPLWEVEKDFGTVYGDLNANI